MAAPSTPSTCATAIEELLRFVSPVHAVPAHRDHGTRCSGDQHVRAGDKVVIWYGAANRDPGVFADPHALDLQRHPNPHVAFGVGPHFCLGAHLARLEIVEMLRHLLDRAPDLTVTGRADPGRVQLHQRHQPPAGAGRLMAGDRNVHQRYRRRHSEMRGTWPRRPAR